MTSLNLPATSGRLLSTRSLSVAVLLLLAVIALAMPLTANAQSYVYVNNQGVANSVVGYSVSSTGSLTEVPGSPYATGGAGDTSTCQGLDRIITSAASNLLFVSNSGDQTISVFQINPTDGSLTAAPGSPFASGLTLDSCQGISLAATPDGTLLMAASNGQIQSFSVAAKGVLMPGPLTTNCCSPTVSMKISATGNLLALSNESSVSVYSIGAGGLLTPATGSPFPITGTGQLSSVDFTCAADRLYGAETSFAATIADAWTVGTGGVLTPIVGSPFSFAAGGSGSLVLSPDNTKAFTNNPFTSKIQSSSIQADGSLKSIGAFGPLNSIHIPMGLATDLAGNFLFAADDTVGVAVFSISGTGTLSPAADVAINRVGTVQGLAAYPPRSCQSGDLALAISADQSTVESGSNVTYTLTLTNNGTSAASATIVDNLPIGESFVSCKAPSGSCSLQLPNPHTFVFTGIAAGASVSATLVAATDANLLNGATVTNTASTGNKSIVDTNPANDSASATITITAQPGPTKLTLPPATGSYGGLAILSAHLQKQLNGASISGKLISFTLNGNAVGSSFTDNTGQAFLTISVAGLALGSYPGAIGASFAGDAQFNPSTGSGDFTVNKAVLTIIPSSASRLYGDANPASFTYNISGFMNTDNASVVSGTATCSTTATIISPVGSYPVTCDISGLSAANYTFAVLPGTLTVNPAPLTVTADNKSRVYGDPNPVFTGTITGLKNGDVLTATYSTTATAAAPVGSYPIIPSVTASLVAGNYAITYVNGTLTVTPASLTVSVDNATRFYGDPNPVLTGSLVGLKNGDAITATYSTTATQASPIGTYPITATLNDPTLKLSNYTVTINNGILTIVPAPLTVTAGSVSRLYGDPNPALTGTIVGIRNGDNITATYSTIATQASPVGTYPIVPTLLDPTNKLSNYAVTIVNGVLTINPAPLTVTIANASRVYGNANPTFTGSITGLKNGDVITATYSSVDQTANVGTYPITPTFTDPGNKLSNYTVVIVGGVLTITKAPLSVVAPNATRLYGDPNPLPTIAGIKNGDNITATYNTPTATSPVGNYTLVPVLVDPTNKLGNYTVTITNGSLTINKAPLSVVANSFSRPYGSANPTFTGTITGVKNGENITASFSTTATLTSNAGTFAITAAAVFNPTTLAGNYTLTTTNGTLTITTVPLTITANNQSLILNGSLPCSGSACATYNGFVLGQTPTNLSGSLSCSLVKGAGNVGTFAPPNGISCSGQSSTNYAITFVQGTYTVQYEPAGFTCSNGPGHVILAPVAANGSSVFTKSTTPTIAVQFRVCGTSGASVSSAGVVSSFVLTSVNGVAASTPAPQGGPFTFVGGTLANGAGSAGWQFNLSTSNLTAGNTYAYKINLNDGTSITFQFKLQ